jgi:hypothetical protein
VDFETAGIANLTYVPTFTSAPGYTSDWPTLGSMISVGTRVVIFMDSYADTAEVDYVLREFTFMWETEFNSGHRGLLVLCEY